MALFIKSCFISFSEGNTCKINAFVTWIWNGTSSFHCSDATILHLPFFACSTVATILLFIRLGLLPDRQWQAVWQKAENFPLIRNPRGIGADQDGNGKAENKKRQSRCLYSIVCTIRCRSVMMFYGSTGRVFFPCLWGDDVGCNERLQ